MDDGSGQNKIGFLQINLAGRAISHDLLVSKLFKATNPQIICVQEPYMSKRGICQIPKGYECFWSHNRVDLKSNWEIQGIERETSSIRRREYTTNLDRQDGRSGDDLKLGTNETNKIERSERLNGCREECASKEVIIGDNRMKASRYLRDEDIRGGERRKIRKVTTIKNSEKMKRCNEEDKKGVNRRNGVVGNGKNLNREEGFEPGMIGYVDSCRTNIPLGQRNASGFSIISNRRTESNFAEVRREDEGNTIRKKRKNECRIKGGVYDVEGNYRKRRKKYKSIRNGTSRRNEGDWKRKRKLRIEPPQGRLEYEYNTTMLNNQNICKVECGRKESVEQMSHLIIGKVGRYGKKRKNRSTNTEMIKGRKSKKRRKVVERVRMERGAKGEGEVKVGNMEKGEELLCDEERGNVQERRIEGYLKVVRRTGNRIRAVIIAPKSLKGYMVSQYSNQDCVVVRFEGMKISVISLYCDIRLPVHVSLDGVVKETSVSKNLIVCADTNAHCVRWGATGFRQNRFKSYKRGDQISEYLDELDLAVCNIIPHLPTFVGDTGYLTYVDATFCSSRLVNRIENWKVCKEKFESDHRSMVFDLKISKEYSGVITVDNDSYGIPWLRLSDKKMGKLVIGLQKMVRYQRRMGNEKDVDLFVQKHTLEIQEALSKMFKHTGKKKYPPCYWWTKEVSSLHKKMKVAKRRMDRYKYTNLIGEYNKCRSDFRAKVKEAKIIAWREYTSNISDPWKGLMKILKRKEVNKAKDRTLCTANGVYAKDMMDTLCLLSDQFYPESMIYTEEQLHIERDVKKSLMDVEKGEDITICEFRKALNEMKKVSAPGNDTITNSVLQIMVKECKFERQYIGMFNVCLKYGIFPDAWKQAKIVLIPKASDMLDSVKSMRPISLTSVFSKLLERIVLARILHYIELSGCLAISQHAYRKGGSTTTALYEVSKFIQDAVYDKNVCVTVFLDISGAFDKTWHCGILFRLLQYGVPKYLVKWVQAFLLNRNAQFSAAGMQYDKALNQGCPQGGVLSPVLWNVFFNDMLTMKTKADQDFHLKIVGYADDAAVLCRAKNVKNASVILTRYLCRIKKWADANRVQFNQSKLKVLVFGKGLSRSPSTVYYNEVLISEVTQYKYLGLTFDDKLTWRSHVSNLMDKLTKVTRMLRCAVREKWGVRMEIMRMLYKTIFCPILLYGIVIWGWKVAGKNMCVKFDSIMRKFCIMSTRCFRSTSNEMLFRLMKTSNFSSLLRQEVLRVALLQLNLFENQKDNVYSRSSIMKRNKPLSMEHFFFLCKQGLNKENMNIVYDNLLHFHSVHPAEWVITKTCINDRVKAIWGSVYMMGWIVYTDASISSYGAGCAIVVYRHGFCVKVQWWALSKCSIFTAETQAVLQAIKYISGIEGLGKKEILEIRSDAQAVIRALEKTIVTDPALKEVKDELRKAAAEGINILLKWVPSHTGIEGNEIADNYAKQAVDSLVSRDMVLGKNDLKIEIRKMIRDQSRKEWGMYKANVPRMFFPTVNEFECFNKSSPSVELCQLVTGHCRLNEFMCNKLAVVSSPSCACGEGEETVFHFMFECMLYEPIRREVWDDFVPSLDFIRKDWKKVDEFIRKTRRFDYKSICVS